MGRYLIVACVTRALALLELPGAVQVRVEAGELAALAARSQRSPLVVWPLRRFPAL
jgi:hypothetical protein